MKKKYVAPALETVGFSFEAHVFAASGVQGSFDIGLSNDAMNGSEALINKRHSYTDTSW